MSSEPLERTVVVTNRHGLHARPCLAIVNTVSRYEATVTVGNGSDVADGSSIHALMALAATPGTELVLSATGPEASQVLETLVHLFADEFGIVYPLAPAQSEAAADPHELASEPTRPGNT